MAKIIIKNLSLDFPVMGMYSNSIKRVAIDKFVDILKSEKLSTKSKSVNILNNLNLELNSGNKIALVGNNGAGKTTFLKTLAGIYKNYRGELKINGTTANLIDMYSCLNLEANGVENIFIKAFSMGIEKEKIENKIEEIIEFSELGDYLNMPVKTYSAGMRVRLLCSLIIFVDQEIVLMDEGIMAGDKKFIKKMRLKINELFSKSKIFILASHNEELVKELGLDLIKFQNGKIIT